MTMARLYSNENFPLPAVQELRSLGHDVLTSQDAGEAQQSIPDEDVLAFASEQGRALLTHNRRHFIRLHTAQPKHCGIIVCRVDPDPMAIARGAGQESVAEQESGQCRAAPGSTSPQECAIPPGGNGWPAGPGRSSASEDPVRVRDWRGVCRDATLRQAPKPSRHTLAPARSAVAQERGQTRDESGGQNAGPVPSAHGDLLLR